MKKYELFTKAMQAGLYNKLDWVVSAFALSQDNNEKEKYAWKISSYPLGYETMDEQGNLILIEDSLPGFPLFDFKEKVNVNIGDLPNVVEETQTTYGQILVNWILLVFPFGNKIPYMSGEISVNKITNIILKDFRDSPEEGVIRDTKAFYTDEYEVFGKACFSLTSFMKISVWCFTKKNSTPPPGLKEYKAKLIKENIETINDPRTITHIQDELVKFDEEYRKGDPGNVFIHSAKAVKVIRSKKFLIHGGEEVVGEEVNKMVLITNSLNEGWDLTKFPEMNNSLRMGSFSRGAETMLGGVEVKWMIRASSNIRIDKEWCGTKLGMPMHVSPKEIKHMVGFSIITKDGNHTPINNEEEAGKYLGQKIMLSSPMFCKLEKTDFCSVCVGARLRATPYAIPQAISAYGSTFMLLKMAAMHGKVLAVTKLNAIDELC